MRFGDLVVAKWHVFLICFLNWFRRGSHARSGEERAEPDGKRRL